MKTFLTFLLCLPLPLCGIDPSEFLEEQGKEQKIADPLEPFNRFVFVLNEYVDHLALAPSLAVYDLFVPPLLQQGVRQVFANLTEPVSFFNQLFQGQGRKAKICFLRFLINTTLGLAGLLDVASKMGIGAQKTSFRQTLRCGGVPAGPYLMLPLLGPVSARHGVGLLADFFFDPVNVVLWSLGKKRALDIKVFAQFMNEKNGLWPLWFEERKSAFDPYVTMRSFYQQWALKEGEKNA